MCQLTITSQLLMAVLLNTSLGSLKIISLDLALPAPGFEGNNPRKDANQSCQQ
jgi:hypothetical protein